MRRENGHHIEIDKKAKYIKKLNKYHEKLRIVHNKEDSMTAATFNISKKYEIIFHEVQLTNWINKLKKELMFSFSIKTNSTSNISANIIGLAFAVKPGVAAYVPMSLDYLNPSTRLTREKVIALLKPILEDKSILKIGKNLKYSCNVLQNFDIELHGIAFDVMLESYVLDTIAGCQDNIDSLSLRWLKQKNTDLNTKNSSKNRVSFNNIAFEEAAYSSAEDADIILQLHLKLWPKLEKNKKLLDIFKDVDMPLVPILSRIERNGVKIDPVALRNLSEEFALRLCELEKKAHSIAGEEFKPSSTKQLKSILFEKKGIKVSRKTPTGAPSTSEEVLEELALEYSLPKVILEYRGLAKLKSNYTDKLPLMINPKTGRIHTSYHQTVTTTGRLTSTGPNLQNIPVRNKEGQRIRKAFIASEDYSIVSADYSQIELRVMAHLSKDKKLLVAFSEGKDIHCLTAAEIFGVPLENVTSEQRRNAKAINFGLIYGMTVFGLSRKLNISRQRSQEYINLYFTHYPDVLNYIEHTRIEAKKRGYVETLCGRRLYLPDITSNNAIRRASAERTAINAPMQGTAADIIKHAMIAIDRWLREESPLVRMIMQVHDELVFEVHKKENMEMTKKKIKELMENSVKIDVPLLVKVWNGSSWSCTDVIDKQA